jgi:molybdate transport system substrate-binding protein
MRRTSRLAITAFAVLGFLGTSCGSDKDTSSTTAALTTAAPADAVPTTGSATTVPAAKGDVVVFAAASLTGSFTELGNAFKAANPDANVTFNFAGSSDLVTQINQGAPADIFASADDANMKKLTDAGEAAGDPVSVATNNLEIIVEKGNPKGIATVADLAKSGSIVVICAPEVPCGKSAAAVLAKAKVALTPASLEQNVKAVVTKVTAGEADAGLVFVTDVTAAGDAAAGVEIPAEINVTNNYPIVVTKEAKNTTVAQAFIDFVAGPAGQKILASYGFLAP